MKEDDKTGNAKHFRFCIYKVQSETMSHTMYITKAIVCGSRASMTSDKSYLLLTSELGMVWATARSVRMEKSKQRCALQDFSLVRISLVRGKATWRIGSVEALSNPFLASLTREARGGVSFVIRAIRRYVHGEEPVLSIFADTEEVLSVLCELSDVKQIGVYQQVFMIRLLTQLGYVVRTSELAPVLTPESFITAYNAYDNSLEGVITKCIEHGSTVSHL